MVFVAGTGHHRGQPLVFRNASVGTAVAGIGARWPVCDGYRQRQVHVRVPIGVFECFVQAHPGARGKQGRYWIMRNLLPFTLVSSLMTRKPLRLWPGVAIVILQSLIRFGLPLVAPGHMIFAILGGMAAGVLLLVWWLFFSRAAWSERLGAVVLIAFALWATRPILDRSIATGAQRMLFPMLAIPGLSLVFVAWAVATRDLSDRSRRVSMVATILLACGVWGLARTGGFTGDFQNDLHWRWSPTPEERLLAQSGKQSTALQPVQRKPDTSAHVVEAPVAKEPARPSLPPAQEKSGKTLVAHSGKEAVDRPLPPVETESAAEWPGFRGPHGDGVVRGAKINTDWAASPPVALWRRPIGPGWSSFAVRGDLLYTQEQRGPDEVVACYKVSTGEPVWAHHDTARFWESNAGAGPRGTPTLSHGAVYTYGATGILNALDAAGGSVVWSHNAASEAGMKLPQWGFASSPLVVGDLVIVAVSGRLVAYDRLTGASKWMGPARGVSYSSPRLLTEDGLPQVLLLSQLGAAGVALADGTLVWEHQWKGYPIVQPAFTPEGDILIAVSDSSGLRRLSVTHGSGGWTVEERWTTNGLKPYFNDFAVHNGHAFGFDGNILACIDLKDGKRTWKGGRYGHGQLVLLADQDLLLVLSEDGELALVRATSDQFAELARLPAIEGKTWNHPALAGDVLLIRNGQEMAAYKLPIAGH